MTELRPWRRTDAADLHQAYLTAPDLGPQFGDAALGTVELAERFIADALTGDDSRRSWAVIDHGRAVGAVSLSVIERRHQTAWASYWLIRDARGRGLATRALVAAASWAFDHDVFRIELGHRMNNPASCRVATRAGFRAEGVERQKLRYGERRFDVELHARLRSDPVPAGVDPLVLTGADR